MNTSSDGTSLSRLHDIVVPAPVSWWPLAPFWLLLALALGVVLLWVLWRGFQRHRREAYRRAALQALAAIGNRRELSAAERVAELATLLRRTALSVWPRSLVAPLTGEAWLAFLDSTGQGSRFADGVGRSLIEAPYDPSLRLPDAQVDALQQEIEGWVRSHDPGRVSAPRGGSE
ncbi:MAG: DUF4381 domain-containing protein [Pseudomonadales bacterium]|jgi:hypothetical protein|nr:DUF4381 domain-containing protein [Pseudomonadales bacterium]